MSLNYPLREEQQRVVDHVLENKGTVVSAGAGTGKTHTTVGAVLSLLETSNEIRMDQFVLITFSRKAAAELKHKLAEGVRKQVRESRGTPAESRWRNRLEQLSGAYVGTIHSFCRKLLRTYGYNEYVARESDVSFSDHLFRQAFDAELETAVSTPGFRDVVLGAPNRLPDHTLYTLVKEILEFARNRGITLSDKMNEATTRAGLGREAGARYCEQIMSLVQKVDTHYQNLRHEQQVLDSHDLLARTSRLVQDLEVVERICQRHPYLFIDEFQDTDLMQMTILTSLYRKLSKAVVVGDRKQSIYYFRGSNRDFLGDAAKHFKVKILPLVTSRRSRPELITVQNKLFASMADDPAGFEFLNREGGLKPDLTRPDTTVVNGLPALTLVRAPSRIRDQDAGLRLVLSQIQSQVRAGAHYRDITLLFRSNITLSRYLEFLKDHHVPARSARGESWYMRPEVITTYRILCTILHPTDDAAFALALATRPLQKYRQINSEKQLIQKGVRGQLPLYQQYADFLPTHPAHLLHTKLEELRKALLRDTVPVLLGRIYQELEIAQAYGNDSLVLLTLDRLRQTARDLVQNEQALSVEAFARLMQMRIEQELQEETLEPPEPETQEESDEVQLMTIHASKGLEFPIVIIPEIHADLVRSAETLQRSFVLQTDSHPAQEPFGLDLKSDVHGMPAPNFLTRTQADASDRLDEEMRLFYVAVTRAQEGVILVGTDAQQRPRRHTQYAWQDEVVKAWSQLNQNSVQLM